jgi:hypothetical protein
LAIWQLVVLKRGIRADRERNRADGPE